MKPMVETLQQPKAAESQGKAFEAGNAWQKPCLQELQKCTSQW